MDFHSRSVFPLLLDLLLQSSSVVFTPVVDASVLRVLWESCSCFFSHFPSSGDSLDPPPLLPLPPRPPSVIQREKRPQRRQSINTTKQSNTQQALILENRSHDIDTSRMPYDLSQAFV